MNTDKTFGFIRVYLCSSVADSLGGFSLTANVTTYKRISSETEIRATKVGREAIRGRMLCRQMFIFAC
jgi:hypothetical protein